MKIISLLVAFFLLQSAPTFAQKQVRRTKSVFVQRKEDPQAKFYRQNWRKFIAVSHAPLDVGLLGGMDPFNVYLKNELPYTIEAAHIFVDYYLGDESLYKTETLVFADVMPGKRLIEEAPNSEYGRTVKLRIAFLECKRARIYYNPYSFEFNEQE